MKLKALKNGFDGFERIKEGQEFDHTRLTLGKTPDGKKLIMPAWCEVVSEKDRDKFAYQGDRARKIQDNLDRIAAEVEKKNKTVVPIVPASTSEVQELKGDEVLDA